MADTEPTADDEIVEERPLDHERVGGPVHLHIGRGDLPRHLPAHQGRHESVHREIGHRTGNESENEPGKGRHQDPNDGTHDVACSHIHVNLR